jgi:hypothetical protein
MFTITPIQPKKVVRIFNQPIEQKPTEKSTNMVKKIISSQNYTTNGEFLIVVKDVDNCEINLNVNTTKHIVIKALTNVIVKDANLIDGFYHEITMNNGSSVELCEVEGTYYIIASDGLKFE